MHNQQFICIFSTFFLSLLVGLFLQTVGNTVVRLQERQLLGLLGLKKCSKNAFLMEDSYKLKASLPLKDTARSNRTLNHYHISWCCWCNTVKKCNHQSEEYRRQQCEGRTC